MAAPEPNSSRSWWTALLCFGGLGLVQTLCFDRQPSVWLPLIAWIPLVWLALESAWSLPRRALLAWVCGSVFWTVNVVWIEHTIGEYGGLPQPLAWVILLLLAVYLGLYWVAFVVVGTLWRSASRSVARTLVALASLASSWVLLELLRSVTFSGFPWSPLGEAAVRMPGALDLSSFIGVSGLSFVIMWVNVAFALALAPGRSRGAGWLSATSVLVVAVALLLASSAADRRERSASEDASRLPAAQAALPVRLVQPNVPIQRTSEQVAANFARLLDLSRCGSDAELIVWPESAAFPYRWDQHSGFRQHVRRALDGRCSLLFNSSIAIEKPDGAVGFSNSALLFIPESETGAAAVSAEPWLEPGWSMQRYDKTHLVPYGEYVPLAEILPFVGQLAREVGEFERGSEIRLLEWRHALFGAAICFEVIFPREVAARVRRGATVLVTLTNDAWFGDTVAPYQHLVSARFRAAENRRPLLFSAVTGITAAIDVRGRVVEALPLFEDGSVRIDLEKDLGHQLSGALQSRSFFTGCPWLAEAAAGLLLGLGLLLSAADRFAP